MSVNDDLERRIADYYESEPPARAPDWVLESALVTIDTTRQRRGLIRVPWRFPIMNVDPFGTPGRRSRSHLVIVALVFVLIAILSASVVILGARLQDVPIAPAVSGTFEPTGNLAIARSTHAAVLLADGRVLVIGGDTLAERWSLPAEMYDPRTGTFTPLHDGGPGLDRGAVNSDGFSATLLADGRVLIAGGWDGNNFVDLPFKYERDAWLFDPSSGTTQPTGPMTVGRTGHAATRLTDGRILIVGGTSMATLPDGAPNSLTSAEIFDPSTGTFSPTGAMGCPRTHWEGIGAALSATVLPSGRVLVTGGENRNPCPNDEIYDPSSARFAPVLTEGPREDAATVIFPISDKVYRYDLRMGAGTDITPRPPAAVEHEFGPNCRDLPSDCRGGMSTTLLVDGRVLLAGGSEIEIAPPGDVKRWRRVAQSGEVLDPATGIVEPTGDLVQARDRHTATLLADGRVLLIGGEQPPWDPEHRVLLSSAEIYAPR